MNNNIDQQYKELLEYILHFGVEKKDRTGTGTKSIFGWQIRHNMKNGFPLITTKKMHWKSIVTELLWFIQGRTDLKYLVDNDCNIWVGDCYKKYEQGYHYSSISISYKDRNPENGPWDKENFIRLIKEDTWFASMHGDLGPIYGAAWRNWNNNIDQITNLINDLKTNPDSRRMLVTAWNPSDLPNQILSPCHYAFQVYTREMNLEERFHWIKNNKPVPQSLLNKYNLFNDDEKGRKVKMDIMTEDNIPTRAISLMYNARSQDVPLGTPFNIASYALLLEIIAKMVNMVPDELIANMGDCHIYLNQIDGVKEQLTREPYELPTLKISDRIVNDISEYTLEDIILENYKSQSKIYFPLSN